MIGRLSGTIAAIADDSIVIDVGGVGYIVNVPKPLLSTLNQNESITIHTEMMVKEDSIQLYGFSEINEKKYFTVLQTVAGVGAKMALNILSQLKISEICAAIDTKNTDVFKSVNGVGPKLAERIVTELKNNKTLFALLGHEDKVCAPASNSNYSSAMEALMSLGFTRAQSFKALEEIAGDQEDKSIEGLISMALTKLNNL
jgi:holliday junction DNA helicase RuvA